MAGIRLGVRRPVPIQLQLLPKRPEPDDSSGCGCVGVAFCTVYDTHGRLFSISLLSDLARVGISPQVP